MKLNIFEGGRRLVYLLQGIGAIFYVGHTLFNEPSVYVGFETYGPGQEFQITDRDCDYSEDKSESKSIKTSSDTSVYARFCFRATSFKTGMLVPYRLDKDGMVWGNSPHSEDVGDYAKKRIEWFQLSKAHEDAIDGKYFFDGLYFKKRWEEFCEATQIFFVGSIILWLFSSSLGWIIRGFAGIPSGADRRAPIEENA